MSSHIPSGPVPAALTTVDLDAESVTALPDRQAMSLLNVTADVNVLLDFVSPIDASVAANLNASVPAVASVSAGVASSGSGAQAVSVQHVTLDQDLDADAISTAPQHAVVNQ